MKLCTLCYIQKDNQTLLLHRNRKDSDTHKGKWNGLGGKLEAGESPEEGVVREVFEESGLTITSPLLIGVMTWPLFDGVEDWYAFVYTANNFEGTLRDECAEGTLHWIANELLLERPMWEGDYLFLTWLLQRRFFSGKFVYKDGELVEHSVTFHPLNIPAPR
jgi:8-oxo-dGTP diphosphatase